MAHLHVLTMNQYNASIGVFVELFLSLDLYQFLLYQIDVKFRCIKLLFGLKAFHFCIIMISVEESAVPLFFKIDWDMRAWKFLSCRTWTRRYVLGDLPFGKYCSANFRTGLLNLLQFMLYKNECVYGLAIMISISWLFRVFNVDMVVGKMGSWKWEDEF